jgi:hypothetical protein
MKIQKGKEYLVSDQVSSWGKNAHLKGQRVLALENNEGGFFSNQKLDVKCLCKCQNTFSIEHSYLK